MGREPGRGKKKIQITNLIQENEKLLKKEMCFQFPSLHGLISAFMTRTNLSFAKIHCKMYGNITQVSTFISINRTVIVPKSIVSTHGTINWQ